MNLTDSKNVSSEDPFLNTSLFAHEKMKNSGVNLYLSRSQLYWITSESNNIDTGHKGMDKEITKLHKKAMKAWMEL